MVISDEFGFMTLADSTFVDVFRRSLFIAIHCQFPVVCLDEHKMLHSVVILSYLLGAFAQTVSAKALLIAQKLIRKQVTNTRFIGYRQDGSTCEFRNKRYANSTDFRD